VGRSGGADQRPVVHNCIQTTQNASDDMKTYVSASVGDASDRCGNLDEAIEQWSAIERCIAPKEGLNQQRISQFPKQIQEGLRVKDFPGPSTKPRQARSNIATGAPAAPRTRFLTTSPCKKLCQECCDRLNRKRGWLPVRGNRRCERALSPSLRIFDEP